MCVGVLGAFLVYWGGCVWFLGVYVMGGLLVLGFGYFPLRVSFCCLGEVVHLVIVVFYRLLGLTGLSSVVFSWVFVGILSGFIWLSIRVITVLQVFLWVW